MQRIPEPELMTDEQQAAAYAGADLSDLHQTIMSQFAERFRGARMKNLLDLGCGSADITIRFANAYPEIRAVGVDGSDAMLRYGREAVRQAALDDRVVLERRFLPDDSLAARDFDAVTANSLLHHLRDPEVLWSTVKQCAAPGASVMVMDLRRPEDRSAAEELVEKYGSMAHPILKRDFFHSLCAAYTAEEVREQLHAAAMANFEIAEVGELHVVVWGIAR